MNPTGTIRGIVLQGLGQGRFNLFDPIRGTPDFANRSASWHGTAITENPGCDSIFKIAWRENSLKLIKVGRKNSEISNYENSIHIDTNSNSF